MTQREIKFRAWSPVENRMYFISEEYQKDERGNNWTIYDLVEKPAWKVMQYTGLLDKNNVEIYEGDILKNGIEVLVVVWGYCAWGLENKKRVSKPSFQDYALYNGNIDVEVIGNKWENPNLLT